MRSDLLPSGLDSLRAAARPGLDWPALYRFAVAAGCAQCVPADEERVAAVDELLGHALRELVALGQLASSARAQRPGRRHRRELRDTTAGVVHALDRSLAAHARDHGGPLDEWRETVATTAAFLDRDPEPVRGQLSRTLERGRPVSPTLSSPCRTTRAPSQITSPRPRPRSWSCSPRRRTETWESGLQVTPHAPAAGSLTSSRKRSSWAPESNRRRTARARWPAPSRAAATSCSLSTTATKAGRSRKSHTCSTAPPRPSADISMTRPAPRQRPARPATPGPANAAEAPPQAPTANAAHRATANAANHNRDRAGRAPWSAARITSGSSASASSPPRSTGQAPTHAAAAAPH
jgi:hypothetical protein